MKIKLNIKLPKIPYYLKVNKRCFLVRNSKKGGRKMVNMVVLREIIKMIQENKTESQIIKNLSISTQ